jgi:hypothetical protein
MITLFLVLIFLLLVGMYVSAYIAWQKVSLFLTWNTRYESVEYEQAITTPKIKRPAKEANKTEQRGRSITPVEDLVDLSDLDFERGAKAIEEIGQ